MVQVCDLLRLKDCHLFGLSVIQSKDTNDFFHVFSTSVHTRGQAVERLRSDAFLKHINASFPGRNFPQTNNLASNKESVLNVTSPTYMSRRRPKSQGLLPQTMSHCSGKLFLRRKAQTVRLAVSQSVCAAVGQTD